jgi:hypothetical protein
VRQAAKPLTQGDGFNVLSGNKTGVPAQATPAAVYDVLSGAKTGVAAAKPAAVTYDPLSGAKTGLPAPKPPPPAIYKAPEPVLNPAWVAWNEDVSMNTELKRLGLDSAGNPQPPKYITPKVANPARPPAPPPEVPAAVPRAPARPRVVAPVRDGDSQSGLAGGQVRTSPYTPGQNLPGTSTPVQRTGADPSGRQYATGTSSSGVHTYSYVDNNGKTHTYLSSGSGPDIPVSTGSSGTSGTSSKVICTHMMRRGLLDREVWKEDMRYALDLPRVVREGYLAWATPLAARMAAGDRALESQWRPWAVHWARYAAWRRGRGDLVKTVPWTGLGVHVVLGGWSLIVGLAGRVRNAVTNQRSTEANA